MSCDDAPNKGKGKEVQTLSKRRAAIGVLDVADSTAREWHLTQGLDYIQFVRDVKVWKRRIFPTREAVVKIKMFHHLNSHAQAFFIVFRYPI